MAIVNNIGCPECIAQGHDHTQNHLMIFEDGAGLCNRSHFHASGKRYYQSPEGGTDITELAITGEIKYTVKQFKDMLAEGKLVDDKMRQLALSGMRMIDRFEVMDEDEKAAQKEDWALDVEHFLKLKRTGLVTRHIKGEYAAFYDVRIGRDKSDDPSKKGPVNRHYYPRHEGGVLTGAKCRTLPKDFRFGHLGKLFGDQDLFGMHTMTKVLESGERMNTLMIVGGELDAVSAQQMLVDSAAGTQYSTRFKHIWSVNKGESAMTEILANKEHINKFKRIIWAFDNDDVGNKLNKECARLFAGKSVFLKYPIGCSDANKCLTAGKSREFVDAWFNPADITALAGGAIKSINNLKQQLKEATPEAGLGWPWPSLNKITLGIRKHILFVIGAGSGVGKTEFCREVVKHLIEEHGESVGIISTEDPSKKVGRAFCGKWMDKRIELPPTNDPDADGYREIFDYSKEEADACIDYVADTGKLYIADLDGDYSIDRVMEACEDFHAMGIDNIFIDNLTGISVPHGVNKVQFLDDAVKAIGNMKDSKPMTIFLITHLSRVGGNRIPHEEGGEVILADARGSGAIGQWSSYFLSIERNTRAEDLSVRTTTYIGCVKDRDQGIFTGEKVMLKGDLKTGSLKEPRSGFMVKSSAVPELKDSTDNTTEEEESEY